MTQSMEWWRIHILALARRGLSERMQHVAFESQDEALVKRLEGMSDEQLRSLPKDPDDETHLLSDERKHRADED